MGRIRINPPAKKLNPQLYTRVTPGDTRHYGSGMIQETPQQFRVGAARVDPDSPPQKVHRIQLEGGYVDYGPREWEQYLETKRRKAEDEQKRKNIAAEAERVRLAHEAEEQRRTELLEEEKRRIQSERANTGHAVEAGLIHKMVHQTLQGLNATPAEATECIPPPAGGHGERERERERERKKKKKKKRKKERKKERKREREREREREGYLCGPKPSYAVAHVLHGSRLRVYTLLTG